MLILLSPAKKLDFETPSVTDNYSVPEFLDQARALIQTARTLEPEQIAALMDLSENLAQLNFARFLEWRAIKKPQAGSKQAVLAFCGDVYRNLDAANFQEADFDFAQEHLRILSGLYGLLRPLDLICPYRLEMGTALRNPRGKDLYQFWGERISTGINAQLEKLKPGTAVVNLASQEYFRAVQLEKLTTSEVWTPVFKEERNGQYRVISFSAKRARGMMSAWLIHNRVEDPQQMQNFCEAGYSWSKDFSTARTLVFTRPAPSAVTAAAA